MIILIFYKIPIFDHVKYYILFKKNISFTGENDVKVFTLAEQIIAALPDRIKQANNNEYSSSNSSPPLSPLEDALMEQMVRIVAIFYYVYIALVIEPDIQLNLTCIYFLNL